MNSEQIMPMSSGLPPPSQRSTCGDYKAETETYGTASVPVYGPIPTTSGSSYATFSVLSNLSKAATGQPSMPLMLPAPTTTTFKSIPMGTTPTTSTNQPQLTLLNPNTPNLIPLSMSMSLSTTPTQQQLMTTPTALPQQQQQQQLMSTATALPTQLLPMPTLEDIEVATQATAQAQPPPPPSGILKYPAPANVGYISELLPLPPTGASTSSSINSGNCGTLKSNAKLLPLQLGVVPTPVVATSSTTRKEPPPISVNVAAVAAAAAAAQAQPQQQQEQRTGWCACFGSPANNPEEKTPPDYDNKKKKRKKAAQTIWSTLLTNMGICTLLLAYTLLGSFIFLTIENEDSALLHQQHTLASTKRNMALNGGNGIYQQQRSQSQSQQQQQQPQQHRAQHTDNDTTAVGHGQELMLEGRDGRTSSSFGYGPASNDFIYGIDETDLEPGGQPQFALAPDTYDVRQRTIENIWDITVSLNILYKENWTKLAALEIAKFQDQLIKRLNEDVMLQLSHDDLAAGHTASAAGSGAGAGAGAGSSTAGNNPATEAVLLHTHYHHHRLAGAGGPPHEWNFAKAFLYSLTVLTTIASTAAILARICTPAQQVDFSSARACPAGCSNPARYCSHDEKRMAEKERRMKRKRQQEELRKQQAAMQEPYYVRDVYHATEEKLTVAEINTPTGTAATGNSSAADIDSLSASESRGSMHGWSLCAPILLCFTMVSIYIGFGAMVMYRLENWPIVDGIYFCFMSLSTIGFGDMLPTLRRDSNATTWFCSVYIMSGMTLTAMCFNVLQEEIVHRISVVVKFKQSDELVTASNSAMLELNHEEGSQYYGPPA
ncbi:uncharacterized protein LOC108607094 [Drosophila busckii]|uniref:uncharacterized protein LOC108607094 n=1 Tax=Drosophila busckii TaxID=30019 RepID=UPI00143336DB|nr:uncharacterized protein LOC108607094 [Drosophila busckii]